MRESIRKQLETCVFANLNNYDEKTNTFYIPQYSKPKYDIGRCYLIKLPGNIVNNKNSVLAVNWNNGNAPQHPYYKAYVSKAIGTLIYVDCLAYDFENKADLQIMWSGYLDSTTLTQIAQL